MHGCPPSQYRFDITIMDTMPRSTRSSTSPTPYRRGHYEYPSPVLLDAKLNSRHPTAHQSGEIYGCRMQSSINDFGDTMLPLPSSSSTSNWPTSVLLPLRSSQPSPNILSAEYDPFAPFQSDISASYEAHQPHHLYPTRSAETSLPPTSPSLSGVGSHRSSFSSAPASETYSHPEPYQTFHPRIKMEDHIEWPSENNSSLLLPNSHLDTPGSATSASPYPGCLETTYFQQAGTIGWPKTSVSQGTPDYSESIRRADLSTTGRHPSTEARKLLGNVVARTRTPRKMTTREDANFQCKAKGCGKLFSRSYNFKAHMETHDTGRVYPFPCPLEDCNKKFVRKTDLQRHHQSVHMKERNYQCDFCSRYFARKDTLRRHMEDGCSKRFDLAVAFNPQQPSNGVANDREKLAAEGRSQQLHSQYSTSSMAYPQSAPRSSSNIHANIPAKGDFLGSDDGQDTHW